MTSNQESTVRYLVDRSQYDSEAAAILQGALLIHEDLARIATALEWSVSSASEPVQEARRSGA